jgi:hypothetical protein
MTVSIRASLLLSALAMAALTAAFVDPPETPADTTTPAQPTRLAHDGERFVEPVSVPDVAEQSAIEPQSGVTADEATRPRLTAAIPSRRVAELPPRRTP